MPCQWFIGQDSSMWMTELLGLSRRICGTLAITLVVAGCGRVDDSVDHHSIIAVAACLNEADVPASQHSWLEISQPGDWNILGEQGTVVASISAAEFTIIVFEEGDSWVRYDPDAAAQAPQELVDVVWGCVGPSVKNPE
jgi:hypothetical protein